MGEVEYTKIREEILRELPVRKARSNKGTYGKVLCIAGSVNMAGAAYLCGYGAYRAGVGLVRVLTPKENRVIIQELLPEAVLTTFDREYLDKEKIKEAFQRASVVAGLVLEEKPGYQSLWSFYLWSIMDLWSSMQTG